MADLIQLLVLANPQDPGLTESELDELRGYERIGIYIQGDRLKVSDKTVAELIELSELAKSMPKQKALAVLAASRIRVRVKRPSPIQTMTQARHEVEVEPQDEAALLMELRDLPNLSGVRLDNALLESHYQLGLRRTHGGTSYAASSFWGTIIRRLQRFDATNPEHVMVAVENLIHKPLQEADRVIHELTLKSSAIRNTLKEARGKRDEVRILVDQALDPQTRIFLSSKLSRAAEICARLESLFQEYEAMQQRVQDGVVPLRRMQSDLGAFGKVAKVMGELEALAAQTFNFEEGRATDFQAAQLAVYYCTEATAVMDEVRREIQAVESAKRDISSLT